MASDSAEAKSIGFGDALRKCGTTDANGTTIGIVNVGWGGLRLVPLALRLFGLVALLFMVFVQHPFGFLPGDKLGIGWMSALEHWELFSMSTWLLAIALYLVYLVTSVMRTGLHRGIPGVSVLFSRYGQVVSVLNPGDFNAIIDPRVGPSAVVSLKPAMMDLGPVEGFTRENIKISTRGALVYRVTDPLLLFQQGGFAKFNERIISVYTPLLQKLTLPSSAREFNRYMVGPAKYRAKDANGTPKKSIDEQLTRLDQEQLSVPLMTELSEIDELDLSQFHFSEHDDNARRAILPALAEVGQAYGVEILDYIPQGNLMPEMDYFQTLAQRLLQSIQRLRQASEILMDVLRQEIDEEIATRVADMRRGLLELQQLGGELTSVRDTLQSEENQQGIIAATCTAMENKVAGILAEYLANVAAIRSRIQAEQIDTAGIERYIKEYEDLLTSMEAELLGDSTGRLPILGNVVMEKLADASLVSESDIVGEILKRSGIEKQLANLKEAAKSNEGKEDVESTIIKDADALDSSSLINRIREELGRIEPSTGIDTERFSTDAVMARIEKIEQNHAPASRPVAPLHQAAV